MAREHRTARGKVPLMTTTLWDYPSQNYPGGEGKGRQGDSSYAGATPSFGAAPSSSAEPTNSSRTDEMMRPRNSA